MNLKHPIFFAGQPGGGFGWGVCNKNLLQALSQLTQIIPIQEHSPEWGCSSLPGHLFTPLGDHNLQAVTPARGKWNYGYTFFENELTDRSVANAALFDIVFAGSSWCQQRLAEKGITHGIVLIQGVDATIFQPALTPSADNRFMVFSGGKFEFRKGQDLVLRAMQVLQSKYSEIVLVNAWHNQWPYSLNTMGYSPYIRFELGQGSWQEQMNHLYRLNGLNPQQILTMPLLDQQRMVRVYQLTDIGLFPNRCEGGTNLVMMEYMACGKPVIASFTSGHCDVLRDENSFLLRSLRSVNLKDPHGQIVARWQEPFLDDVIAAVENAYLHRDIARQKGLQGAMDMSQLTWARTAATIVEALRKKEG